jgi:hypothetical protein
MQSSLSHSEKLPFILTGDNKLLCSKASQAAVNGSVARGSLVIALRHAPREREGHNCRLKQALVHTSHEGDASSHVR